MLRHPTTLNDTPKLYRCGHVHCVSSTRTTAELLVAGRSLDRDRYWIELVLFND